MPTKLPTRPRWTISMRILVGSPVIPFDMTQGETSVDHNRICSARLIVQ